MASRGGVGVDGRHVDSPGKRVAIEGRDASE